MGQRSRKRGRRDKPVPRPRPAPARGGTATTSRSEEKNAAVRATLTPFAPGERPWVIRVCVVLAVLLGIVNVVLFFAGVKPKVGSAHPHLAEVLVFAGLMFACAAGMWYLRYWAVLGFMTLLAIGLLGFSLALIRVTSVAWGAVCVVVIAAAGFLFIRLVRVLSRIQMPKYPGR